jgi:hypothetical protein
MFQAHAQVLEANEPLAFFCDEASNQCLQSAELNQDGLDASHA